MHGTKDPRVQAKRAGRDLGALLARAMSGEGGRGGAEEHGLRLLGFMVQLFIGGEGPIPDTMRGFVERLCDRKDPLRRDIPPDAWGAIWPQVNTLMEARRTYLVSQADEAKRREEAAREVSADGTGILGNGPRAEGGGVQ